MKLKHFIYGAGTLAFLALFTLMGSAQAGRNAWSSVETPPPESYTAWTETPKPPKPKP